VLTDSKDKRERERGIPEKKHLGARKERDGEKGIQTMPCPMPMHTYGGDRRDRALLFRQSSKVAAKGASRLGVM
jgi:hypothetical protein